MQPGFAEEGPTISERQHQRLSVLTSHDASMGATEQRLACLETQAEHRGSCPSEALAEAADQLLGDSHSITPTATAQIGNLLPPELVHSAGTSISTALWTQANQAAATRSPIVSAEPLLHGQSGLFTQLLQGEHDTALDGHAEALSVSNHNSAWGLPGADAQPNHCQQAQQQQVSFSPTVSGQHQALPPQSPAEGLKAMFARPAVSPKPPMKRYPPLTHRSDKRYRSHRSKAKPANAACIQQAFPHRQWHTLDDVLQDLDMNDITFVGTPIIQDQRVSALAGPSTPAFLPEQYVDTHPSAYLQLPQQENQPASPSQPTHTLQPPSPATGLERQRPPLCMPSQPATQPQQQQQHQSQEQQQQHRYTPSVSQMAPQHEQAAVSVLPLLLFDLAASGHDGRHVAASAQQRLPSTTTPTLSSPSLLHHATLLQPPQHMGQFSSRSSHNSSCPEDPQDLPSPSRSVALALDRLFSTNAQPTTSIQRRERHRQAQQSPSAGGIPTPSSSQFPAPNCIAHTVPISWDGVTQHGPMPAASDLYAPQPASSLLPDTPAALAQGGAGESSVLQTPWSQWQQPESYLQEPNLQQDVDQAAYPDAIQMPDSAADPAVAQHVQLPLLYDCASAHLPANSLQSQLPPCPATETTNQQGGHGSATPLQEARLNGCLDALDTGSRQHQLVNSGAAWADSSTAADKAHQSRCTPSTSTISQSDPDSPTMIAQLPLCSPERMSAASSALYSPPVVLWNSPASSAASLPIAQQGGQDGQPATSPSRPILQQNSQHQLQQGQQQLHRVNHTAMQSSSQHGRISPPAAMNRPFDILDNGNCFTAFNHRPAEVVAPSGPATAQLVDEQGSFHALEEIALRAKRLLKSLEPACSAAQLHPACAYDRVMPFLSLTCF